MKKITKSTLCTASALLLSLSLLTGCGTKGTETSNTQPAADTTSDNTVAGTVLLSVNPEIEVAYNYKGAVLEIEGLNDAGKNIIAGYTDYRGDDCNTVVNELVKKIYESGYFEQTVGGKDKNIVIKLEEGSSYPDEQFLETIAQGIRDTIKNCGITSAPMTIDDDDYDERGNIGLDKAKELALAQAGLKDAEFTEKEYQLDDGIYELEFTADNTEYEFEVDAFSGKVLEADYEHNDDWNDSDDLYDHDDDFDDDHDDDFDDDHDDDDDDDHDDDDDNDHDDDNI